MKSGTYDGSNRDDYFQGVAGKFPDHQRRHSGARESANPESITTIGSMGALNRLLAEVSIIVVPLEEIDIGPISSAFWTPKLFAVQSQVFLAVVENLFDFFTYRKPEVLIDGHVAGIKDRVDVFP